MSSSWYTLPFYFPLFINFHLCCVIMYLKHLWNAKEALQEHAKEEQHGGRGDGTRSMEIEEEWEGATGRKSLLR